jgi:hypothetical protein
METLIVVARGVRGEVGGGRGGGAARLVGGGGGATCRRRGGGAATHISTELSDEGSS